MLFGPLHGPQSDAAVSRIALACLALCPPHTCLSYKEPACTSPLPDDSQQRSPTSCPLTLAHVACRHHSLMRQTISSAGMSLKCIMETQAKPRCLGGHMLHLPTQIGPGQCRDQLKLQSSKTWLKQKQVPSSAQLLCPLVPTLLLPLTAMPAGYTAE